MVYQFPGIGGQDKIGGPKGSSLGAFEQAKKKNRPWEQLMGGYGTGTTRQRQYPEPMGYRPLDKSPMGSGMAQPQTNDWQTQWKNIWDKVKGMPKTATGRIKRREWLNTFPEHLRDNVPNEMASWFDQYWSK